MFERRRSPIFIQLSSDMMVSRFFDLSEDTMQKLCSSEEDQSRVKNMDAVCYVSSHPLTNMRVIRKLSRELAYAVSLIVNSANCFPALSASFAAGNMFSGFANLRLCLEGLVRSGAIICAEEGARKEILYRYENGFRDHLARRRKWVGQPRNNDNLPTIIGKLIANPLTNEGDFDERIMHGRSEKLQKKPSKKADQREYIEFAFAKLADQLDYLADDTRDMKQRLNDWHSLSSSFLHADPFAIHLVNSIRADSRFEKASIKEIFFDVIDLLAMLYSDTVVRLLDEIGEVIHSKSLIQMRAKYI
jgi:hypothetical protein